MTYEIITDLTESKLIMSKAFLKKYNAKDIADTLFLSFLALEVLSNEFKTAVKAKKYAAKTMRFGGKYDNFRYGTTDIYLLLHILVGKNNKECVDMLKDNEASAEFIENLNLNKMLIRQYLIRKKQNKSSPEFTRRLLLKLQQDLEITRADYRNMRILVSSWHKLNKHRKSLVITRMLQFFRARAVRSDLYPPIKALAKVQGLELKGVDNAETGKKGIKGKDDQQEPAKSPWWLKAAAFGAGAVAGYSLVRRKK